MGFLDRLLTWEAGGDATIRTLKLLPGPWATGAKGLATLSRAVRSPHIAYWAFTLFLAQGWMASSAMAQQIIRVRAAAPSGGDGSSWATAFNDLQMALTAAAAATGTPAINAVQVWVASGTYRPAGPGGSRSATFQMRTNVAIYGGFAGGESSLSQRDAAQNQTILSGDLNADDLPGSPFANVSDNVYHVVTANGVSSSGILDGLTISGGSADLPNMNRDFGGGLIVIAGGPVIRSCVFTACQAKQAGGAVALLQAATPSFALCTFATNRGIPGNPAQGGAIASDSNGRAGAYVMFSECLFQGNSVENGTASTLGGAVCAVGNALRVLACTFRDNSAGQGGAVYANKSVIIVRSSFESNSSFSDGGALWLSGGGVPMRIEGCLLSRNQSLSGGSGGITYTQNTLDIVNCTIVANASRSKGAIGLQAPANANIRNSIVWGNTDLATNTSNEAAQLSGGTQRFSLQSCIVQSLVTDFGPANNALDPVFVDAPTFPNHAGDARLLPGSPALDSGLDSVVSADDLDADGDGNNTEPLPWDLDGDARIRDSLNAPGSAVDRGCYEGYRCDNCPDDRDWRRQQGGEWSNGANWSTGEPQSCAYAVLAVPGPAYTINYQDADAARGLLVSRGSPELEAAHATDLLLLGPPLPGQSCPGTVPQPFRPALRVSGLPSEPPTLTVYAGTVRAGSVEVGDAYSEVGTLTLDSPPAKLVLGSGSMFVGDSGTGTLSVLNGANCSGGFFFAGQADLDLTQPPDGVLDNHATIKVDGPGSVLKPRFGLNLTHADAVIQNSGVIDCGTTGTVFILPGSNITGDGTVIGRVVNFGELRPRPPVGGDVSVERAGTAFATFTVNGEYEQIGQDPKTGAAVGNLNLRIGSSDGQPGGPPGADKLIVNGPATLAGALVLTSAIPGYSPAAGVQFDCLSATSRTGAFTVSQMPALPGLKYLLPTYTTSLRSEGVSVVVSSLTTDITLNPAPSQPVAGLPRGAVIADFDNDGDLDLAISVPDPTDATSNPGSIVVLRNAGNTGPGGTWAGFTQSPSFTITVGHDPRGLAVGKFNGPGDTTNDLAVCNFADGTVRILHNLGSTGPGNTWAGLSQGAQQQVVNVGAGPIAIAAGDIRGGGLIDLAVANQLSNSISVINNNGSGGFAVSATLNTDSAPTDIILANLDAQPGLDIAAANRDSNNITVYYRQPGGTYHNAPDRRLLAGNEPGSIEPGQIDNGKDQSPTQPQDLVCANRASGTLSFFLNDGNGGFTPGAELPAGTNPESVTMGDLDDDGDPDLAVVTTNASAQRVVRVFRNDLTGTTLTYTVFGDQFVGDGPQLVRAADVDANGRADLIAVTALSAAARDSAGERTGGPVASAKLSKPPCADNTVAADLNSDAHVDTADLTLMLSVYGQPTSAGALAAAADINHDGTVNTPDLVRLLLAFGLNCP